MKKLSTLVLGILVASSICASPLKIADASAKARVQTRAEAWYKAHALDRASHYQAGSVMKKPAVGGEAGDTIRLTPANIPSPEYYPESGDWFIGFGDVTGNYVIKLDWINQNPDNAFGTFTTEDMDLEYSYIMDYTTFGYVNYIKCNFTIAKEVVSPNLSTISLDAVIDGDDGKVYVVKGKSELLTPQDTVRAEIKNATIQSAEGALLIAGTNEKVSVNLVIETPALAGEYGLDDFVLEKTEIKVDGKAITIADAAVTVAPDATAENLLANLSVLDADTVMYEIVLSRPLVAKNTIEATLPNLTVDASWAGLFGSFYVDASNANIELIASAIGLDVDTAVVYSSAEGTLEMTLALKDKGVVLSPITATLKFALSEDGDLSAELFCFATDENIYKLHLCWQVPTPKSTTDIVFGKRARAAGFNGQLQLIGESDKADCAVAVQNWELDKDLNFGKAEALLEYTFLSLYEGADTVDVQIAASTGTVTRKNDTLRINAALIGFDSIQYNVSLWYNVPEAKEVKNLGTINAEFYNMLSDGGYQLLGASADGEWAVSVTPLASAIAGSFENDGWFTSDFDWQYTYLQNIETEAKVGILKAKVDVTLDNEDITAIGFFLCEDEVEYRFVLKSVYEGAHVPYDMEDTPVNAVFTAATHRFEIDDQYMEAFGALTFAALGLENNDDLELEFTVADADPVTVIPAGVYQINDTYEVGTSPAGDFDGNYIYPCFFGQVSGDGLLSTTGLYFLVTGTITVEKVGGKDLHIVVDAYNSYNVPVKIDINTAATAIDNVKDDAAKATKVLRNGQLVIERNGVEYNASGARIK